MIGIQQRCLAAAAAAVRRTPSAAEPSSRSGVRRELRRHPPPACRSFLPAARSNCQNSRRPHGSTPARPPPLPPPRSASAFARRSLAAATTPRERRRDFSSSPSPPPSLASGGSDAAVASSSSSAGVAVASSDGVVGIPIDFDVASHIEGKESQIVTVRLEPGQVLRAESGAMMYMTEGVTMNTTTGGGLSSGFQRFLTGQNIFISDYIYEGNSHGLVALGTDFPSKIIRLSLDQYGGKLVCQKGALLCASHTVDIQMEFAKKFTAGFFGGEGFVLQGLTGTGDVMVKAGGTLIKRELGDGEVLKISSGCLVCFSDGVNYDVQMVSGFKNVVFGGEGLFLTTLTGPGTVWLQGQPPERMIGEIARRVPSGGGIGLAVPIPGMGGGSSGEGGEGGGEPQPATT